MKFYAIRLLRIDGLDGHETEASLMLPELLKEDEAIGWVDSNWESYMKTKQGDALVVIEVPGDREVYRKVFAEQTEEQHVSSG